jgi:transcriptional regulator with XRE-family HTH domain
MEFSDQIKALRKENQLTQEAFAAKLGVTRQAVSNWENGRNLPDISLLVELAEFYQVSIPEIIDGERKSENMDAETKDTAAKMAAYSKEETRSSRTRAIGIILAVFGVLTMISALMVFPPDSSWGSLYSIAGGIVLVAGAVLCRKAEKAKKSSQIITAAICALLLFGIFSVSDYVAVTQFHRDTPSIIIGGNPLPLGGGRGHVSLLTLIFNILLYCLF